MTPSSTHRGCVSFTASEAEVEGQTRKTCACMFHDRLFLHRNGTGRGSCILEARQQPETRPGRWSYVLFDKMVAESFGFRRSHSDKPGEDFCRCDSLVKIARLTVIAASAKKVIPDANKNG